MGYENQGLSDFSDASVHNIASPSPSRAKARKLPVRPPATKVVKSSVSTPVSDNNQIPTVGLGVNAIVKVEDTSDNQDTTDPLSVSIPASVSLSHTQSQSSETSNGEETKVSVSEISDSGGLSLQTVKVEPITEGEMELEITGVELAAGATGLPGDWGQNVSGEFGYQPAVSGDDSQDQSSK